MLPDPTRPEEEITLDVNQKLPEMAFTNITGGEPFIRQDIADIVRELYKKSDRIVISTNGYFTDRIIALCKEFPKVGIRISIEGLQETNDKIRGIPDGFNRGYTTLKTLVEMGHPDVGFGMTVQDMNCEDLCRFIISQMIWAWNLQTANRCIILSISVKRTIRLMTS